MGKSVLELFKQKEILNYQKDRKYPALMGEELFPEVKKRSLKFDMIVNKSKTPVIASVHGFDTESEIGQREAQKKAIELALIQCDKRTFFYRRYISFYNLHLIFIFPKCHL